MRKNDNVKVQEYGIDLDFFASSFTVANAPREKAMPSGRLTPVRSGRLTPVRCGRLIPVRSGRLTPMSVGLTSVRTGGLTPVRSGGLTPVTSGKPTPIQFLFFKESWPCESQVPPAYSGNMTCHLGHYGHMRWMNKSFSILFIFRCVCPWPVSLKKIIFFYLFYAPAIYCQASKIPIAQLAINVTWFLEFIFLSCVSGLIPLPRKRSIFKKIDMWLIIASLYICAFFSGLFLHAWSCSEAI